MTELKQANISLSKSDYDKLTELMFQKKELNRSAYIRSLIERAWEEHQEKEGGDDN